VGNRGWHPEYSFRSSDFSGESRRPPAPSRADDDDREDQLCTRGDYCADRAIRLEDGARVIIPARSYGHFCPACSTLIGGCLADLPSAWSRLAAEIGELSRGAGGFRTPLGPRLPLRADYDALMRSIAEILLSWEERTRDVARLSVLDTQASRRRDPRNAVEHAAELLGAHLTVLLALPPGPMLRAEPVHGLPDAIVLADLGGRDAGEEILRLHFRSRAALGEVRRQPEILDGVPCKMCEAMTLERSEPPSDPKREAMWSVCAACRHTMSKKDFDAWAKWYSAWAASSGVACRRCQIGASCPDPAEAASWHGQCQWQACACAACGHAAA
jgi:hypothetical protein